jgi:ribosomal 30S subunit maturation factor RimM
VGTVLRAHGVQGLAVVGVETLIPPAALPGGLELEAGGTGLVVSRCSVRSRESLLVGFAGIDDRERVEELKGQALTALRLEVLRIEGFLPSSLFEGMELTSRGETGTVQEVDFDPSNPRLTVSMSGRSFPVPVNMVLGTGVIDWTRGTVEMTLPEGLSDLEAGP